MNDKWIKPFQEKLGDYELELPAASPRRHGWIALALTGAAAAAAVLLFLLPTTGRPSRENPVRLLAEVPASVAVPTLSAPAQLLAPVRHKKRTTYTNSFSLFCFSLFIILLRFYVSRIKRAVAA